MDPHVDVFGCGVNMKTPGLFEIMVYSIQCTRKIQKYGSRARKSSISQKILKMLQSSKDCSENFHSFKAEFFSEDFLLTSGMNDLLSSKYKCMSSDR